MIARVIIRWIMAIVMVATVSCATCDQPAAPKQPIAVKTGQVTYEYNIIQKCTLPPFPVLPTADLTKEGCPKDHFCFNIENAIALAMRFDMLMQWTKEARARCPSQMLTPQTKPPAPRPNDAGVDKDSASTKTDQGDRRTATSTAYNQ